ncbi:MAG: hypothetical protein Phog2KO_23180 [Phototrophicaceae bacterium]
MQFKERNQKRIQGRNLLLPIILIVSLIMGVISAYDSMGFDWRNFLGGISIELIGGVITFYLIDNFVMKNADETSHRKSLISQLENRNTGIVQRAVQELRAYGWLQDGSLYGWFIQRANFDGIHLEDANVNGLGLFRCSLKDVRITEEQLAQLNDLRLTHMPDGNLYDGRFCLSGDIEWARTKYGIDFMVARIETLAEYYEVSTEDFIEGQYWAYKNLPKLGYDIPPYLQKLIAKLNDR